jgi:hypothetical protein
VLEPHGRAGYIVYTDGDNSYRVPYEYGTGRNLLAVFPKRVQRADGSTAELSELDKVRICERIRSAIEAIDKKSVAFR